MGKNYDYSYEWDIKYCYPKGSPFCNCIYIEVEAEKIFSELRKENYLIEVPKLNICDKLAYYLGKIATKNSPVIK